VDSSFSGTIDALGQNAARQIFIDIADDIHETQDIDKILVLVENVPLAIDLIANLVNSEGMPSVLGRWEKERTSVLSEGHDTTSNLNLSISLSLSGARLAFSPGAQELLSLLSILPDGLSDVELLRSQFLWDNILACKSTLLRTALAYTDDHKRLKVLVPIREYVQENHPPSPNVLHPLYRHYQELLELYRTYQGTLSNPGVVARIASNFANIQNILLQCLNYDYPHLVEVISSACELIRYSRIAGHGALPLVDQIPRFLPQPVNHKLEAYFLTEVLNGWLHRAVSNATQLLDQTLEHFEHFHDPDMKCELILILSFVHLS
jgi:hypothetical protein